MAPASQSPSDSCEAVSTQSSLANVRLKDVFRAMCEFEESIANATSPGLGLIFTPGQKQRRNGRCKTYFQPLSEHGDVRIHRGRGRCKTSPAVLFQQKEALGCKAHLENPTDKLLNVCVPEQPTTDLSSTNGTTVTLLNAFLGSGVLVLPYAFRLSGWLFVLLFVGLSVLMGFTLWLTGYLLELVEDQAMEMGVERRNRDWGMLGYIAFGRRGRLIFTCCALLDLYGGLVTYNIMTGNILHVIMPMVPKGTLVGIVCAIVFGLLLIPEKHFSGFAMLGLVCIVMMFACLLITGSELVLLGGHARDHVLLNFSGLPASLGIGIYSFVVHSEAPLVYQMMEDRNGWTRAVTLSTIAACSIFLALGMLGYAFFGGSTAENLPENLGRDLNLDLLPGSFNAIVSYAAAASVAIKLLVNQPLTAAPVISAVEQWCVPGRDEGHTWHRVMCKAVFMFVTVIFCVTGSDSTAFIMELVGIVPQNMICIVLPFATLLRLAGDRLNGIQRWGLKLGIVAFTFYSLYGAASLIITRVWSSN